MNTRCTNCGRNTSLAPESAIEWNNHLFCSESCLFKYNETSGACRSKNRHHRKTNIERGKLSSLPGPLKTVVWLNIAIVIIGIIDTLAYVGKVPLSETLGSGFGILVSVLIIVAIIEASRFVRGFVLICSWITAIVLCLLIPVGLINFGPAAFIGIINLLISAVTIWGLTTRSSKAYFGY